MDTNELKNKEHIEKIYSEKAIIILKYCIGIYIFSFFTYAIALFFGNFDFGLIFETISFIFTILSLNKIKNKDFPKAKKYTIFAMIPIGWLIIYDLINLLVNIKEVITEVIFYYTSSDQFFYHIEPYLYDIALVATIILLFLAYKSIRRADGTDENNNPTDAFYEKL